MNEKIHNYDYFMIIMAVVACVGVIVMSFAYKSAYDSAERFGNALCHKTWENTTISRWDSHNIYCEWEWKGEMHAFREFTLHEIG